ncbi:MAG: hypothetical protein A2041_01015 [Bacteroidetes bacterium GWA2_31_9b]|nr:MAG: hypothetical protein A2041_01015 [Bacteroidetes bacterium GWA2_31_9b]
MKKILLLLAAFAFISLPIILNSCEEDPTCKSSSSACGTFEACCTTTDCYYLYDGEKYNCDGTDCDDAALELASVMCSKSNTTEDNEKLILDQTNIILESINN